MGFFQKLFGGKDSDSQNQTNNHEKIEGCNKCGNQDFQYDSYFNEYTCKSCGWIFSKKPSGNINIEDLKKNTNSDSISATRGDKSFDEDMSNIEYENQDTRTFEQFPRILEVSKNFPHNLKHCLELCKEQIQDTPDLDVAYSWTSDCLIELGRENEAEELLYDGIEKSIRKNHLYSELGQFYLRCAEPLKMTKAFIKSVNTQSKNPINHTPYLYIREICIACSKENMANAVDSIRESIASYDLRPEAKNEIRQLVDSSRHQLIPLLKELDLR